MNNIARRAVVLIMVAAVVTASASAFLLHRHSRQQEAVKEAYIRVHYAFCMGDGTYSIFLDEGLLTCYTPLDVPEDANAYGVYFRLYFALKLYKSETGRTIAYRTAADYLSEEFEPDGTRRLYNNGLHPEIEEYVEWAWAMRVDEKNGIRPDDYPYPFSFREPQRVTVYVDKAVNAYIDYCIEYEDEGFNDIGIRHLSPKMFDELARKVDDPSYEMDLLSLQRQGY